MGIPQAIRQFYVKKDELRFVCFALFFFYSVLFYSFVVQKVCKKKSVTVFNRQKVQNTIKKRYYSHGKNKYYSFIQDIETQKWNNVPLLITQYNNIITDFIDKFIGDI